MPKKIDWPKLKKDELLSRVGAKLSKDELVQIAEGLHTGALTGASILAAKK